MIDFRFKVCIFGDGGVGKTTLTQRYLTGVFKERYSLTIGMDFYIKKIELEGKKISLQIWDFAGEEKFRFLMPNCLMESNAAIFMYDMTRYKTFENLNDWIATFEESNKKLDQKVLAILIGGKLDLQDMRTVSIEEGITLVKKHGLLDYMECSSKTGANIGMVFEKLGRYILKNLGVIKKVGFIER